MRAAIASARVALGDACEVLLGLYTEGGVAR
jgi:hypothetical protein